MLIELKLFCKHCFLNAIKAPMTFLVFNRKLSLYFLHVQYSFYCYDQKQFIFLLFLFIYFFIFIFLHFVITKLVNVTDMDDDFNDIFRKMNF